MAAGRSSPLPFGKKTADMPADRIDVIFSGGVRVYFHTAIVASVASVISCFALPLR